MTATPDTLFVTGEVFEQLAAKDIKVTPSGGTQTTLALALTAAGGGTVTEIVVQPGPFLAGGTITAAGTIGNSVSPTAHGILLGQGPAAIGATAAMLSGQILVGQGAASDPIPQTMGGDATINNAGNLGLVVTGVTAGIYGSASQVAVIDIDAKGRVLTAANATIPTAAQLWNAGTVSAINATLTIGAGNTLGAVIPAAQWNAGTVSAIGAGLTIGAGNTLAATASGGLVTAVKANQLAVTSGTLALVTGPVIQVGQTNVVGGSPMIINANSDAASEPALANTLLQLIAADNNGMRVEIRGWSTVAATAPDTAGVRARGTALAPTAVQAGDVLYQVHGFGYGATGYSAGSPVSHRLSCAENWTDTAQGTQQQFFVSQTLTTASFEAARITSGGQLLVGTTVAAGADKLQVAGGIQTDNLGVSGTLSAFPAGPNLTVNAAGAITAIIPQGTTTATAAGTLTITGTAALGNILIDGPAAGGTVTIDMIGSGIAAGTEMLMNISQGATAATWAFAGDVNYGAVAAPTITATAGKRDILKWIRNIGTVWDLAAINQGFSP